MSIRVLTLWSVCAFSVIAPVYAQSVTTQSNVPVAGPPVRPVVDLQAQTGQQLSTGQLVLQDVITAVLRVHPELKAAQQTFEAAGQRPVQERSLPDPMITTGYTSVGNPLPGGGLGSDPNANLAVMVSQEIPFPGKRGLRAEVAKREAEAERQQIDVVKLSLVSRVKQAYFRLATAYQLDEVLRRNDELLTSLLKVSESRYAVGQAAQQDVIRTQTQLSLLALQRQRVARERRTREGELNALLNRLPDAPLGRPADLAPFAVHASLPELVQLARAQSPMLRRESWMIARSEAAVDVAKSDFKPDFAVSGGYAFAGSMPDMYEFRFDVVVPLQRARRRAAVAERESQLGASRQTLEASRLSLEGRLQEDYQMATTAAQLATLYRETVLPQARLALESSVNSYQTGGVEFLSVLTNFGSVLEYEMSYIEQLTDLHVAASRLEEMAAVSVVQ
jgi:outer membrane protein TolC